MQVELNKMNGKSTESVELNEDIFNLKPDFSVISSLVRWNESNKKPLRARTKNRSEVAGTTQKLGRQKGGGGARHGSKKANIFRSGGMAHNLRGVRSLKKLPKRLRNLAVKHILSEKVKCNDLIIIDELKIAEPKTKILKSYLDKQKINSALFLEGDTPNQNLSLAARNLKDIKYLSVKSVNALDLLRHQKLIISKDALAQLEKNYI